MYLFYLLFALVSNFLAERHQIKHGSQSRSNPISIQLLQFLRIQVRRCMRYHFLVHPKIIPTKNYLSDGVALIPVMLNVVLYPKSIKTIDFI
jgi:hypothetical protein